MLTDGPGCCAPLPALCAAAFPSVSTSWGRYEAGEPGRARGARRPRAASPVRVVQRPCHAFQERLAADRLEVVGLTAEQIARAASPAGVLLLELTPTQTSLEDAFFGLTDDSVEYRSGSRTQA